jgi:CTP:molybdopterin cytidylyltransferase MocA
MNLCALIPAAGVSRRMGREKLRLPLEGTPLLAHLLQTFRQAGVEKILVVLGPRTADLAALVTVAGAEALCLPHQTADMQETVQQGLAWLQRHWQPTAETLLFLCPADYPAVRTEVLQQLVTALTHHPETLVAVPLYADQRGHPVLCRWPVVEAMQTAAPATGLNRVMRQYEAVTLTVPVPDQGVLLDVDTPEDWATLAKFRRRH